MFAPSKMHLTRSKVKAGVPVEFQSLPSNRRPRVVTQTNVLPLQEETVPSRRQEEVLSDDERSGGSHRPSGRRREDGSVRSYRTGSSTMSQRRRLELEEQRVQLRERKRQADLEKANAEAELQRAQANAEAERVEDMLRLLELQSENDGFDDDDYGSNRSICSAVTKNTVDEWISTHVFQDEKSPPPTPKPRSKFSTSTPNITPKQVETTSLFHHGNKPTFIDPDTFIKPEKAMSTSEEAMLKITETFADTLKNVIKSVQPNSDVKGFIARQSGAKELPDFYGDPEDWPGFVHRFDTSSRMCQFSNDENLIRLQRCLKGRARETVAPMISAGCHVQDVMDMLEKRFGRPDMVMKKMLEKVRYANSPAEGDLNALVDFSIMVKNLCATAESLRLQVYVNSPQLLDELKRKLPSNLQLDWGRTIMKLEKAPDIVDFARFLDDLSDAAMLVCDLNPTRRRQRDQIMIVESVKNCVLKCGQTHSLEKCTKFKNMPVDERWKVVTRQRYCFSCISGGHRTYDCSKSQQCGIDGCSQRHHKLLHAVRAEGRPERAEKNQGDDEKDERKQSSSYAQTKGAATFGVMSQPRVPIGNVLMKIVPVEVVGPKNKMIVNAFLDDGSSLTILDEEIADKLGLSGEKQPLHLSWQGGRTDYDESSRAVSLRIRGICEDNEYLLTNARTKKNLQLPSQPLSNYKWLRKWNHLESVPFPDVLDSRPMIVIGEDNMRLMLGRKFAEGPKDTPIASWTYLGWVVHGPTGKPSTMKANQISMINMEAQDPDTALHELVKQQFRLESLGIVNCPKLPMSANNKRAEDLMESHSRRIGESWETCMLWKTDTMELPNSKPVAWKRLLIQERQIDKDRVLAGMYCAKIDEYVQKGFCLKLNEDELSKPCKRVWYLPHFGHQNPNKPGKLRFVFDCAAKVDGMSLNDALIQGRDLMSPLVNVLLKFRQREVAFCGDIRDMFHMVRIKREDSPTLRFLWRGMDRSRAPDIYEMNVMIFGAVSSPFQAQWIKNRNASEFQEDFPDAVDAIHNRHYVDDYLDSCSTEADAIKKICEVREIHRRGGFEIRGWHCSSPNVLNEVAPGEATAESIELSEDKLERVLGLYWKTNEDVFKFKTSYNKINPRIISGEKIATKRELLQLVMSIYDPLGFIGHLTVRGRILLQDVWKAGTTWDEPIPASCVEKWKFFVSQVMSLSDFAVPRCFSKRISNATNIQLHTMCDHSQQAYGTISFLRVTDDEGHVSVNIVMAKSRVTPIKCLSIPRLELEAALVGARQTKFILDSLDLKIHQVFMWTDSKNVLWWIRAVDPSRFKMYVAHRIGEILDLTDVINWRWVPTAENVADDCTRDACAADLSATSRWINGPDFLKKPEVEWPTETVSCNDICEELEVKQAFLTMQEVPLPMIERFSSWIKLVRVTAWILRYFKNLRLKKEDRELSISLKVEEIPAAIDLWIRKAQQDSFEDELSCMISGHDIPNNSKIKNLSPVLIDGIIRVNSRLVNSPDFENSVKYPVILDKNHPLTDLLVGWYHELCGHYGYEKVCNELRQSYWILGMKELVKRAAKSCMECQLRRAKTIVPEMAALPDIRLTQPERPFTFTGVDYFGPLDVIHGRKHEKRYGVLFTCLSIRAVHLEVAHSLSTDDFLMALERFMAIRGEPREIWSDNGTNFRGAEKELAEALKQMKQEDVYDKLSVRNIDWNFIPPSSPHMGGAWERLVRSVKISLAIILKNRSLTDPLLQTVLAGAMASVNSRPLTTVSTDPSDPEAITPNHFLIGSSSLRQSPGVFDDGDLCSRKRWRHAQVLKRHFWNRWKREYLSTLSLRPKWRKQTPDVKVGDLVFLADMNEQLDKWHKGLVTGVFPGKDGRVRVVDVKTATGVYRRPVVKLHRIPEWSNSSDSS